MAFGHYLSTVTLGKIALMLHVPPLGDRAAHLHLIRQAIREQVIIAKYGSVCNWTATNKDSVRSHTDIAWAPYDFHKAKELNRPLCQE